MPGLKDLKMHQVVVYHRMSQDFDMSKVVQSDGKPVRLKNNVMVTVKGGMFLY